MASPHTHQGTILLVAANPSISSTTGWPVGFWASELTHPYYEFTEAGYKVTLASPQGGEIKMDAMSDPQDPSGYSSQDLISLGFLHSPGKKELFKNTVKISDCRAEDYSALVVVGGQSPMFTFAKEEGLQRKFLEFYHSGKPTAALCHGVALLLYLKDKNGEPFVKGKSITGFANSEEDFADQAVGQKLMPFRIEDEAKKLGARFVAAPMFTPHVLEDGNLITGQQQFSGRLVAEHVLQQLKRGGK